MPRKIVALSIYLENDVVSDPPHFGPKIEYLTHDMTFPQMAPFFPGLKKEDLPDGAAWAVEKVELITHNGTHLDAPYHFHPTMNKGERAIAIDEVDLNWCFQPGVKLGGTSAIAISRNCTISRPCRPTASSSPASRTRSAAPRRAGHGQSRFSIRCC